MKPSLGLSSGTQLRCAHDCSSIASEFACVPLPLQWQLVLSVSCIIGSLPACAGLLQVQDSSVILCLFIRNASQCLMLADWAQLCMVLFLCAWHSHVIMWLCHAHSRLWVQRCHGKALHDHCSALLQSRKQLDTFSGQAGRLSLDMPSGSGSDTATASAASARDDEIDLGRPAPAQVADTKAAGKEARWGATYPAQIKILLTRTIKTRRFEALGRQDVAQFLIVGILSGGCCSGQVVILVPASTCTCCACFMRW